MLKRCLALFVLAAFFNLTLGCTKQKNLEKEKFVEQSPYKAAHESIIGVTLIDGTSVDFTLEPGRYFPESKTISGLIAVGEEFRPFSISVDSVSQVWVKRTDALGTTLTIVGITAGVLLTALIIALATKESCPFIYSYDGQQYRFDAEPLGGAVCPGLMREDLSRLEYLKAVDGKYKLLLKNEVRETQYLDRIQLLVVEHPHGTLVASDTSGNLCLFSSIQNLKSATDESGRDISAFLNKSDGISWQTIMTEANLSKTQDTRHHLTLVLPKPNHAKRARLIVNCGTAMWGSHMIREMLQMRGAGVDRWYDALNNRQAELAELFRFLHREEVYHMTLHVQRGSEFVERSLIRGGGPLITEERVLEFDVSDIPGDSLVITLNPPKGFWSLDYFAVEYDQQSNVKPRIYEIDRAQNHNKQEIYKELKYVDSMYYVMPGIGDWAEIEFDAPVEISNMQRSLFLKTAGYYEIQVDKTQVEQKELIGQILSQPDLIASYAQKRFVEWRKESRPEN